MRDAGVKVMDVSEYTGAPEMMDGRVKTLHPKVCVCIYAYIQVHGGILAVRGNPKHEQDMIDNDIKKIDLVVLNLYAFEDTVKKGYDFNTCIENIDIGGPSMLRSSAKNHASVVICSSPAQYAKLMEEVVMHSQSYVQMKNNDGCTTLELRRRFAAEAYALSAVGSFSMNHLQKYDAAISSWFALQLDPEKKMDVISTRPYLPVRELKYGCNPHQKPAGIYKHMSKDSCSLVIRW